LRLQNFQLNLQILSEERQRAFNELDTLVIANFLEYESLSRNLVVQQDIDASMIQSP